MTVGTVVYVAVTWYELVLSSGCDSLGGPLGSEQADSVDGPEQIMTDKSRLDSRSDDDDTSVSLDSFLTINTRSVFYFPLWHHSSDRRDFEEDCPYDWINELEKIVNDC